MWLMKIIVCQKRSDPMRVKSSHGFRLPGVANLRKGFVHFRQIGDFFGCDAGTNAFVMKSAVILARSHAESQWGFRWKRWSPDTGHTIHVRREVDVSVLYTGCCCTEGPEERSWGVSGRIFWDEAAFVATKQQSPDIDVHVEWHKDTSGGSGPVEGSRLCMFWGIWKRPRETRVPIPELIHCPQFPFNLDESRFFRNLRSAKRGAVGGPSDDRREFPLLDFTSKNVFLGVREIRQSTGPHQHDTVRLDRFSLPETRRCRGRRVGDKDSASTDGGSGAECHGSFSKRSCHSECITHLQEITEFNPRATVISIDGITAHDLISRRAIVQGLCDVDHTAVKVFGRTMRPSCLFCSRWATPSIGGSPAPIGRWWVHFRVSGDIHFVIIRRRPKKRTMLENNQLRAKDLSCTTEPHITFCTIYVHPLIRNTPFISPTSYLSNLHLFSCFEHFSRKCQNRTFYISGRFCPKIKPQTLETLLKHSLNPFTFWTPLPSSSPPSFGPPPPSLFWTSPPPLPLLDPLLLWPPPVRATFRPNVTEIVITSSSLEQKICEKKRVVFFVCNYN